jgi:hypothetical protein
MASGTRKIGLGPWLIWETTATNTTKATKPETSAASNHNSDLCSEGRLSAWDKISKYTHVIAVYRKGPVATQKFGALELSLPSKSNPKIPDNKRAMIDSERLLQ